jgi:hypothetical protein
VSGLEGLELDRLIGSTDRGVVWRASRNAEHDRLVRFVDPRFCDGQFRQSLTALKDRPGQLELTIVGDGWTRTEFFVEYKVTPPWVTLGERLATSAHWFERLRTVDDVLDALAPDGGSGRGLGLGLHGIVLTGARADTVGLAACPAIALASARDLCQLDPIAVSTIAPEVVRGIHLDHRMRDAYATASVVALALGCRPSDLDAEHDRAVEAQARGALLRVMARRSDVEPFLREVRPVVELFDTLRRYRHPDARARPQQLDALRVAARRASDEIALAQELESHDQVAAETVLSWPSSRDLGRYVEARLRFADLRIARGDHARAADVFDELVRFLPNDSALRRRRCAALWQLFQVRPTGLAFEREAPLLEDLDFLSREPKADVDLFSRMAAVHRAAGRDAQEVAALSVVIRRSPTDVESLYRHAELQLSLDHDAGVDAVTRAGTRLENLRTLGADEGEVQRWKERFEQLLR